MKHRVVLGAVLAYVLVPAAAMAEDWVGVEVVASSTAKGKADKFAAWRALDGNHGTAWCEGKADEGAGETITLRLSRPVAVSKINLMVGKHGSAKIYQASNRVSKLAAASAEKAGEPLQQFAKAAALTSAYDTMLKLDLRKSRMVTTLEIGLAGVERGDDLKVDETCITELQIVNERAEVVELLYGVPPEAMTALPAAVTALRAAVASCDDKALARVAKFPVVHSVEAEEDSYTAKLKNAKALAKACKENSFPKIPVEVDQVLDHLRGGASGTGVGRISLEVGTDDVVRLELQWHKGTWLLVSLEGH